MKSPDVLSPQEPLPSWVKHADRFQKVSNVFFLVALVVQVVELLRGQGDRNDHLSHITLFSSMLILNIDGAKLSGEWNGIRLGAGGLLMIESLLFRFLP
jgi:hypothetical protein